jgi:hypothetical protein
MRKEPVIILWDIETLPNLQEVLKVYPRLGAYPGLTLKASITSIICVGWKLLGKKQVHCINAWDFKRWKKDVNDDYEVVKAISKVLSKADCVVTHNGKRFDWKFLQTRLLHHNLPPLPNIMHIDTCVEGRKVMVFNNRLDTLGGFLANERKLENGGWDLWVDVWNKKPKALKLMEKYCKQDVRVLEKVFMRLRPLMTTLPNHNLWTDGLHRACPNCGSVRMRKNGFRVKKNGKRQAYQCGDCGTNASEPVKHDKVRLST